MVLSEVLSYWAVILFVLGTFSVKLWVSYEPLASLSITENPQVRSVEKVPLGSGFGKQTETLMTYLQLNYTVKLYILWAYTKR